MVPVHFGFLHAQLGFTVTVTGVFGDGIVMGTFSPLLRHVVLKVAPPALTSISSLILAVSYSNCATP
jgi:hypothetical protein